MTDASETSGTHPSATQQIVDALTRQITEHRLAPGARIGEQKFAEHFGVSRTLIRQALFQMGQQGLIRMEAGRGAFVAQPSVEEARQVFAVRRMLEGGLTRDFIARLTPAMLKGLEAHLKEEQAAVDGIHASERVELLGDFHVLMAQLMGNEVAAEMLRELISRCALITLLYQSNHAAQDSADEHRAIVKAIAAKDADQAVALMDAHLLHVEAGLALDRVEKRTDKGGR
jgi:DNA-binding GntR family transcriptional regulator